MNKSPAVKILIGYHKPAILFKSDTLTPIHLGRALATQTSKDGTISATDYQWMLDNMIGDDTGNNISSKNRLYAELTALYWAWKNYNELENPDYIGLFHYRRLLNLFKKKDIVMKDFLNTEAIETFCAHYDVILPEKLGAYSVKKKGFIKTIKEQYVTEHFQKDIDELENIIKTDWPEMSASVDQIFYHSDKIHWKGMFVMKRELFMEYCPFLFEVMAKLETRTDWRKYSPVESRVCGFLGEFVLNIFLDYKQQKKPLQIKEVKQYMPLSGPTTRELHICLGTDNQYIMHTATAMISILKNSDPQDKYNFYILSSDLSRKNKKKLQKLTKIRNCHITCLDIDQRRLEPFKVVRTFSHLNLSSYNRLLIPQLFMKLKKVLYIDSDTIAVGDIGPLWDIDPEGAYFVGMKDPFSQLNSRRIGYENAPYINAGITIFNCQALQENHYFETILSAIDVLKDKADCADQEFINYCFHDHFKLIPQKWNVFLPFNIHRYKMLEPQDSDYLESKNDPKIIHFVGPNKPWLEGTIHPYTSQYWQYRNLTPWKQKESNGFLRFFYHKEKDSCVTKYKIFNHSIFRITQKENVKSVYFLGIRILKKKIHQNHESVKSIAQLQKKIDWQEEMRKMRRELANLKVLAKVQTAHSAFSRFRNMYVGKDVVLCATGPSSKYYIKPLDAIHVGVNGATRLKNVKLDYLFVQDQALEKRMNMDADEYDCIKFYGVHSDERALEIAKTIKRISMSSRLNTNAYTYLLEYGTYGHFAYDITYEPFGDFCSTVFSALQFILYTHPKRIYLVGCDCSSGYFYKSSNPFGLSNDVKKGWILFKRFVAEIYPDVEIISINPVGLKGMFADIYMKEQCR